MKIKLLFTICAVFCINSFYAQQTENRPQNPIHIGLPDKIEHVPSIASRSNLQIADLSEMKIMADGRAS